MINFRFHLVSLTAVFLALAAGIAVGAAVVDRASVDFLEDRLDAVEANRNRTNTENDELRLELGRWDDFATQAGDQVVQGRLAGVPVVFLAVQGIDRGSVDALRQATENAGAANQGVLWLTPKWNLDEPGHTRDLAGVVGTPLETRPDVLRRSAFEALAAGMAGGAAGPLLVALEDKAFVDFQPPAAPSALEDLPLGGSRFVVLSGHEAEAADDVLAVPLTAALVQATTVDVLAAEVSPPPPDRDDDEGVAPSFTEILRSSPDIAPRLATVDTIQDYRARVAAVLALARLGQERTGHYGVGPGAQRLVPEATP